ncbi:MAG: sterol-binding protein [Gammaproteobacteria bacterium HGW-Gammaproteobacteria-3]|nr:MAG: sterol-binding protein [Gammaproteobacteria bacterium HGW-Gammaproteobacteria-3]
MILKPLLTGALETALNHYLALDSDVGFFLAPLAGKVIAITVLPFNETIYLCPTTTNIQVLDTYPGEPDTTLTGSAMAFGLMGLSGKPMRPVFSGEITLSGDMQTGRKLQTLFDQLDIDPEEKLAQVTGDIVAHKIGRLLRTGQQWGSDTLETLKLNTAEFLQEESRDLPAGPEAAIFYRQVDTLRADFDRLCARIERLQSQSETRGTHTPDETKSNN